MGASERQKYVPSHPLSFICKLLFICAAFFSPLPQSRFLLGHIATHKTSERWRGNNYIRDDGILPYQRCGVEEFQPGPERLFSAFMFDRTLFHLVATSASLWGSSFASGEPTTEPVTAELLVLFTRDGKPCRTIHYWHCGTELITPPARCRLRGGTWRAAKVGYVQPPVSGVENVESVAASTIECPLGANFSFSDHIVIEFEVGSEPPAVAAFAVDICYQHVEKVDDLVMCTQPHYGYNGNIGSYWIEDPPFPHGSSLVDAFLVYHWKLHGLRVVYQDVGSSFLPSLIRYNASGGAIKYRPNWELSPSLNSVSGVTNEHEIFAEATCFWDHRISARWHMQGLSSDCFLLPTKANVSVRSALAQVDQLLYSELAVPMVRGFSAISMISSETNVLQRYALMGRDLEFEGTRQMPIGNPRHYTYTIVHWLQYGRKEIAKAVMRDRSVLNDVGLHAFHSACLCIPLIPSPTQKHTLFYFYLFFLVQTNSILPSPPVMALNGRPDDHIGVPDTVLAHLANKLSDELRILFV